MGEWFPWAFRQMWDGKRVMRSGWDGRWLELPRKAAPGQRMPVVQMRTTTGEVVPWLLSETDRTATDWRLFE